MRSKLTIAIVGAGSLGQALAVRLDEAGYRVKEVAGRGGASQRRARALARRVGARAVVVGRDDIRASVVWLCVPDRAIRGCAEALAGNGDWVGRVVLHSSGALSSDELKALEKRGAATASVHPLMTFVSGVVPGLAQVPFAVEGDPRAVKVARSIVRDLGGVVFAIRKGNKAAYHAWGAFASPLLLATLVTAEEVAGVAGIGRAEARRRMLPIVRQTIANYASRGPAGAFSGPIIRGDAAILEKHLRVLRRVPEARAVYLALARAALKNLPAKNKIQLRRVLA